MANPPNIYFYISKSNQNTENTLYFASSLQSLKTIPRICYSTYPENKYINPYELSSKILLKRIDPVFQLKT